MDTCFIAKVGDRVIISRSRPNSRFAEGMERLASVSAVRPTSFDAGGLCFRYDGREWRGRSQVRLISEEEERNYLCSLAKADEESRLESTEREREDVILASLLTYRHEKEWLELGLDELRRIASMLRIGFARTEVPEASDFMANQ